MRAYACNVGDSTRRTADLAPPQDFDDVVRTQHFVEARDGALLHVVVVAPANATEPLPIILKRTPYGISRNLEDGPIETAFRELAEDGYIFAYADVPYRLRTYTEMLADWNETVDFDWDREQVSDAAGSNS